MIKHYLQLQKLVEQSSADRIRNDKDKKCRSKLDKLYNRINLY